MHGLQSAYMQVPGLGGPQHCVVQGSCGGTHTLVLTAQGRLFTWGRGSFGRLGVGASRDCSAPVEVALPGMAACSALRAHGLCIAIQVQLPLGTGRRQSPCMLAKRSLI